MRKEKEKPVKLFFPPRYGDLTSENFTSKALSYSASESSTNELSPKFQNESTCV